MTRAQYLHKRAGLLNEAKALLDAGNLDGFQSKKAEVEALDNQYQEEARAMADFNALNQSGVGVNLQDHTMQVTGMPFAATGFGQAQEKITNASDIYVTAWAKRMQSLPLTDEEQNAYTIVNEVHTTENTGIVIPKTVVAGIFDRAAEMYPMFADANKTNIQGKMSIIMEDTSSDAAWYDESTPNADGKETFAEVELTGCELARSVKVSWKLKSMAVADFLPYITRKMAEKMGAGLGHGTSHGKGKPGSGETFKPEPLGVVTALEKETGTPQITTYTAGGLTYKDMVTARKKIGSKYETGIVLYAQNETIWGEIAMVLDDNKRPIFILDVTAGGVGRTLGCVVKPDDSLKAGEIIFSNMGMGYQININESVTIRPFEDGQNRLTNYVGYAIVDGTTIDTKAHSLLKYDTSAGE